MSVEQRSSAEGEPAPPTASLPSPIQLWLERIGIGLVAAISLLVPLVIGLLFYLAVTDGLVISADDPLHEVRLWMVQERRGATGLGLTITSPIASKDAAVQCARTDVTFLKWDGSLRVERDADYCRCYERKDGQLVETGTATCR
jgi:hypothetical protein